MPSLRALLSALVVLSLAVTPVAARTMPVAKAERAATAKMAMSDCHNAMAGERQAASGHASKTCPDCDKTSSCAADGCQLKCFKVLGAIPSGSAEIATRLTIYDPAAPAPPAPWSWKPGTPPPRA
jgi:hypothetical protein